ncbi:conserved hypothetical protein [Methylocella silvestris BL2]|uniref:Tlde1 domain-containing protein n=1 Tax=Methylocella silvestris (strain DSM 15510 / CIP 108128 / LMG 27833 / NCIMB 13906 / BL2) TaxID=395965 RepID=B8EIC8_METSB|nr:DUF2778 domain-containing protein [Methylocella silvestris]ACK51247.1 conserved hypothetical protein [Methylocella silvestris BL2]
MTQAIYSASDFVPFEARRSSPKLASYAVPFGGALLALSALVGGSMLNTREAAPPSAVDASQLDAPRVVAPQSASSIDTASNHYGALTDPGFSSLPKSVAAAQGVSPAQDVPPASKFAALEPAPAPEIAKPELEPPAPAAPQFGETAPLPTPRPPELRSSEDRGFVPRGRRLANEDKTAALPAAPADNRNFFEKLLGMPPQQPTRALAYAAPEEPAPGPAKKIIATATLRSDRYTAIYDISARTVYMPDGTRLEAHSGLGELMDDPRHVDKPMRGATPPNVYELSMREELFHGVQALRLTPIGGEVYGRNGFLAHTYMLGAAGASNGCVSFKNYGSFLQAYQNGSIKRLLVVARLN